MTTSRLSMIKSVGRWPFVSPLAAPFWLGVRIYLGAVWLRFGIGKLNDGWLTSDPLGPMFSMIGDGNLPATVDFYQPVIAWLSGIGATPLLSVIIPLAEVVFAISFLTGLMIVPMAIAASLLNANLILAGVAAFDFDGRVILLQLLLVGAWRVAGELGLGDSVRRLRGEYRAAWRAATSH